MEIGQERAGEARAIHNVTDAAFATAEYSGGNEARIVDALREAGALTLSLVATDAGEIVGHVAFSPITIDGAAGNWFGLGPVSVHPKRQREGIGQSLIRKGLDALSSRGAAGCVVFGEPNYYGRFGFEHDLALSYHGAPPGYFQRVVFRGAAPIGEVAYHLGFDVP